MQRQRKLAAVRTVRAAWRASQHTSYIYVLKLTMRRYEFCCVASDLLGTFSGQGKAVEHESASNVRINLVIVDLNPT